MIRRSAVAGETRDLVTAFMATDERSVAARQAVLQLLGSVDDPFSRHAQPDHITATAVVFSPAGVLLHLHKQIKEWIGPGGHVDPGESPMVAVVREAMEETGLAASHPGEGPTIVDIDVHPTPAGHVHYDLRFLLLARPDEPSPGPGESPDVRWFELSEAINVTDDRFRPAIVLGAQLWAASAR